MRGNRKKMLIGYSGYPMVHIDSDDARIIKGMLKRGDRQHDIAAYFGCYPQDINHVATGRLYSFAPTALARFLPPPGPYSHGETRKEQKALLTRLQALLAKDEWEKAESLIATALNSI